MAVYFRKFMQCCLVFVVSAILFHGIYAQATTKLRAYEVEALLAIKADLGDSQNQLSSWSQESDPCGLTWKGLNCAILENGERTVAELTLDGLDGLMGILSSHLGRLSNLAYLSIYGSPRLSGILPATLSNLTSLQELTLTYTNLTGPLPDLCNSPKLSRINLSHNRFTGNIHEGITCLDTVSDLDLSWNKLYGAIPAAFVSSKPNLRFLYISHNMLSESLPAFTELPLLEDFQAANNNLTGEIPLSLATQQLNLTSVDLSNNRFTGEIPPFFQDTDLSKEKYFMSPAVYNRVYLNVAYNLLSGGIPASLNRIAKQYRVFFNATANNLSGPIPDALLNNRGVIELDGNPLLCGGFNFSDCSSPPPSSPPPPSAVLTPSEVEAAPSTSSTSSQGSGMSVEVIISLVLGIAIALVVAASIACLWRRRQIPMKLGQYKDKSFNKSVTNKFTGSTGHTPFDGLMTFTYSQILEATNGFHYDLLLGRGGFGHVYKGILPNGQMVAIKVLNKHGNQSQGEREYAAEVEAISHVHHRHLVQLAGFCSEGDQRVLVYEYVPNGSLASQLHDVKEGMPWNRRMRIACGAAKGLAYLHEACVPRIIHRDIKPANILLDEEFEAKIADFGLAKIIPDGVSIVTTRVLGTWGYVAPEYADNEKVDEQADVYSYGMVLLEIISGKQPFGETDLLIWAKSLDAQEQHGMIADANLFGDFNAQELRLLVKIAIACLRLEPLNRPSMSQVVQMLEGNLSIDDFKGRAVVQPTTPVVLVNRLQESHMDSRISDAEDVSITIPILGN